MSPDLELVMTWFQERLQMGDIPRIIDVVTFAKENKLKVKRKEIVEQIQLHPTYMWNMEQKRQKANSNKFRPILGVALGVLHSDIGFFLNLEIIQLQLLINLVI